MFADRYGWNSKAKSAIELQLEDFGNHSVGRVRRSERDWDLVEIEGGPVNCERRLGSFGNYVEPAVGDWVLVSKDNTQEPPQHVIRTISERQNNIERRRSQPGAIRSRRLRQVCRYWRLLLGCGLLPVEISGARYCSAAPK